MRGSEGMKKENLRRCEGERVRRKKDQKVKKQVIRA
jgi:hypothetical protein